MKILRTQRITLDGLPLLIDYEWSGPDAENPDASEEVEVLQIWLCGWEILSIVDDRKIAEIRRKLINGEGKEATHERHD